MSATELKELLHEYIDAADEEKLEEIYSLIEKGAKRHPIWDDDDFVSELDRREKNYWDGKTKGYTLEESVERARQAIKNIANK